MISLVLAAALAVAASPMPAALEPAAASFPGIIADQLDAIVSAETARGFSGAVLVTRRGEVLLDKAYGSIGATPMRTDTRFWIASGGKQFVSAAILRLADQGRLSLDDPLAKFFPAAPADKAAITLRQLLSHTSGLGQSYVAEDAHDRAAAVRLMLAEPLTDTPGAKFHYSNSNYQLAAAVIETVSGRAYRDFVTAELWRPAGLRRTGMVGQPGSAEVAPAREPLPPRLARQAWGEQGVYSTTHDLARWYGLLRSGPVLAPASAQALFTPVAPIGEGQAALGWFVGKTDRGAVRVFTRGNEDFGPNALLYAYPASGVVVVVLTHAGDADADTSWSRKVHGEIEVALGL